MRQLVEVYYDLLEGRPFLSQSLRLFRLVPDVGLLQFALDLRQALCPAFVVKGTPLARWCARQGRRFAA
jgi:hypothetical protein